jgi:hypothetical protein
LEFSESCKPKRDCKVVRIELVIGIEKYIFPDVFESNEDFAARTYG